MKVYEYRCNKCGTTVELEKLLGSNVRHLNGKKYCGNFLRVWGSANFNRVPGGGRA